MIAICLLCFLNSESIQKQPHLQHQWEYRVLLVISNNYNDTNVMRQLKVLQNDLNGFKERKLLLYQVYREGITKGLNQTSVDIPNEDWYQNYSTNKPFEILLFGLDGSKKLYQNELLTLNELFALIDKMPMRKSELKKINKQ